MKLNLQKRNKTPRFQKQTYSYQRGNMGSEGQIRRLGLTYSIVYKIGIAQGNLLNTV